MHPRGRLHVAHQQAREPVGEGSGFALREVDQNVGDVGRLLGQVDTADGVRLVFGLGEPFGLGVGSAVG